MIRIKSPILWEPSRIEVIYLVLLAHFLVGRNLAVYPKLIEILITSC